jgi:ABC-type multidrug transport system ATPase subunit
LTVKETLRFSADCQMAPWVRRSDRAQRVDTVLQVLGLSHRANTVVGDALLRGVSGGEKKRVTIGVEAVKDASIFLMDEPTTGLDSSASYDVRSPILSPILSLTPLACHCERDRN